jgi:putative flippase GtrA
VTVAADADLLSQLVRFASIGAVSTIVFAALFWVMAGFAGAVVADVVALGACSVANTAANRRLTFLLRGRTGRRRHYTSALALGALPLVATLLAIAAVHGTGAQLLALTTVNGLASLVRFFVLRHWVFG